MAILSSECYVDETMPKSYIWQKYLIRNRNHQQLDLCVYLNENIMQNLPKRFSEIISCFKMRFG